MESERLAKQDPTGTEQNVRHRNGVFCLNFLFQKRYEHLNVNCRTNLRSAKIVCTLSVFKTIQEECRKTGATVASLISAL